MKPYILSFADLVALYGKKRAMRLLITVETVADIPPNISPANQEERLHDALAALGCLADEVEEEGDEILPAPGSAGDGGDFLSRCSRCAMEALEAVANAKSY